MTFGVRSLTGGGEPATFDGESYQVANLMPAAAPTPPVWVGVGGPKGLAVTGRNADGWIPPHVADWQSTLVSSGMSRHRGSGGFGRAKAG